VTPPISLADVREAPLNGAKFVSAYSGCGGMDVGFRLAGFEPVWANDVDPFAVDTYNRALGEHAICADINAVEWPGPRAADLVVGGPPCQGFSVAGKMDPYDPRSRHVDRFLDLVAHVSPAGFVMENVKALAVSARWAEVREHLRGRANALGYRTSLIVLHAADFGVAQRRERMFLIGLLDECPPEELPVATPMRTTVREALSQLPPFGSPGNDTRCAAGITPAKRPVLRPSPYQGSLLFNGNGRPLRLDSTAPTLPASMGGNATPILDQHEVDTGEESWIVTYHRRLMSGGRPLKRAPRHLRRISVEEAAQLQSFPLEMPFAGPTGPRYRQVGNAVPPLLAYHVARHIAELLGLGVRNGAVAHLPAAASRLAA
jgi:DNA (cytosine-5)-methyltransferase 1